MVGPVPAARHVWIRSPGSSVTMRDGPRVMIQDILAYRVCWSCYSVTLTQLGDWLHAKIAELDLIVVDFLGTTVATDLETLRNHRDYLRGRHFAYPPHAWLGKVASGGSSISGKSGGLSISGT